ncbi:hypothetical protein Leryth_017730, partial [Lithospermum erythrorhizon]
MGWKAEEHWVKMSCHYLLGCLVERPYPQRERKKEKQSWFRSHDV